MDAFLQRSIGAARAGLARSGRRRASASRASVLFVALVAPLGASLAARAAADDTAPLRIREIWVPESELLELAAERPDGVVVSLAEYRRLVLAGVGGDQAATATELPPLEATVTFAEHLASVDGKMVRVRSRLDVEVLAGGWVRCALAPLPPALGRVVVDGVPGWIVQTTAGPRSRPESSFLLVRGKGRHQVDLEFSLPALEVEDRWRTGGDVPQAQSSRLVLDVDGRAEATSTPKPPLTEPRGDGTRFTIALGTATTFAIEWRRQRSLGENDALLAVVHGVSLLARRDDPLFAWNASIAISRRETDVLELVEAAGMRVVDVAGERVHSWDRVDGALRVRLDAPATGAVELALSGVLAGEPVDEGGVAARRYALGVPALRGAYSNTGYVGVRTIDSERIDVEPLTGLTEIAAVDAAALLASPAHWRTFSFTGAGASLRVTARPLADVFETRAACRVRVLESGVTLDGVWQVGVREGRVYRFASTLPAGWRLAALEPLADANGATPALRHEIVADAGGRQVEIEVERAARADAPLAIRMLLELEDFAPDISWVERLLEVRVPRLAGAARTRVDVAISLADSVFAIFPAQPAWSTLGREELRGLGLDDGTPVAGLSIVDSGTGELAPIALTLRHRRPLGDFQAVTHVLALEGRVRVRTDVRLAVVDRAIDALRIRLPVPQARTVLIPGDGIREVVASESAAGSSLRVVRYARPWIGTREFRIEYEAPRDEFAATGGGLRVPWARIEDGGADPTIGSFLGEQSVVFQSLGPIKIEVDAGDELVAANIDELPEVGEPWADGRSLFGFRFRSAAGATLPANASPASFRVVEFARAEAIDVLTRELELTTVIDASGVSRTRVDALIAYDRGRQHLDVALEPDSRLLSVSVDDRPELRVRAGAAAGHWQVPLPSRSYARISIVYERGSAPPRRLRPWGTWRESGPVFAGVPVVESR